MYTLFLSRFNAFTANYGQSLGLQPRKRKKLEFCCNIIYIECRKVPPARYEWLVAEVKDYRGR
jgi:hypothetical protein